MPLALAAAMRELAIVSSFGVVVTIVATFALAPGFGAVGVAVALLAGQLAAVASALAVGRRHASLGIAWAPTLGVVLAASAVVAVSTTLGVGSGGSVILRVLAGGGLFVVLLSEGTLVEAIRWTRSRAGRR
jgi:O-antigen/teichoic acid export membrane protein